MTIPIFPHITLIVEYGGKYSDNLKNVSKAYGSIDHAYIFSIIMVYFTYHV